MVTNYYTNKSRYFNTYNELGNLELLRLNKWIIEIHENFSYYYGIVIHILKKTFHEQIILRGLI